jgi:uncharacterized protein YjbI with pentapeptide repeats
MPPTYFLHDRRRHGRPRLDRLTRAELADRIARPNHPLSGLDLAGFDLRNVDLSGRDLSTTSLARTRLNGANLERANLRGCIFARADLHGTRLVGADLRETDLSSANGLTPDQLRDCLLGSARLPDGFAFDGLDRVRDLVNRAERQLHLLLLSCISMAVIAFATEDAQFFVGDRSLTLPGVNLPVRLSAFFVLAPLVLFGLYFGVSFTLRKLWYELASLPAQFANRRGLHEQAAPSTPRFTAPAALHLSRRIDDYAPALAERRQMIVLVWWVTPVTLLTCVWAAYLPRHDAPGTWGHVLVTVATAWWGVVSYRRMDLILSGRFRTPHGVPGRHDQVRPMRIYRPRTAPPPPLRTGLLAAWRGGTMTARSRRRMRRLLLATRLRLAAWRRMRDGMTLVAGLGVLMLVVSCLAMRDIGCRSLTARAGKTAHRGCSMYAAGLADAQLDGLRLIRTNLRRAFMHSAQLRRTNLEDARLEYATLIAANLTRAKLKDANLRHAVLWEAEMDSVELKEARLAGADLRGASLRHAELQGADFTGAALQGVNWTGAIVCGAIFTPGSVDTVALRQARGWELAFGTGMTPPPLRTQPPAWLTGDERREYDRWSRAWDSARVPPPALVNGRVQYAATRAWLQSIDLSMGESRQREKELLLADLEVMRESGTLWLAGDRFSVGVDSLRSQVARKAANHCVDIRDGWVAANGDSGRPSGRGFAEM